MNNSLLSPPRDGSEEQHLALSNADPGARNPHWVVPSPMTSSTYSPRRSSTVPSINPQYEVFISHAGEDKATIAIPLREMLLAKGITAFVDEKDMPPGTEAERAMIDAMERAQIGVIVLSPEFVARKWPVKELMCFLRRRDECIRDGQQPPQIIPFFYRLKISELYDEPRLDRCDQDGNNLYTLSRFHERQRNGEPEASIGGIKSALERVHGTMGVRNDVEASNESSHLMSERRKIVLEKVCKAVCDVAERIERKANTQKPGSRKLDNSFEPHFEKPNDVSNLVFWFDCKGGDGNRCSQEGQVLDIVLERQAEGNASMAVWGIAGVGKTSLLEGIMALEIVRGRFRDGVYRLSIGKDATHATLTKELSMAVKKSGGKQRAQEMLSEGAIGKVTEEFRSWFEERECLFVVDDVWETDEVSARVIHGLFILQKSGRDSKILVTTRSPEIAARAECPFGLRAREPLHEESRAILYRSSGLKPGVSPEEHMEDNRAVDSVLERCGGLPLFLAVAGRAVKSLWLRSRYSGCTAYRLYAEKLKRSTENLVNRNIDSYDGLHARLIISVELLEERRERFGFATKVGVAEMHRRLCVTKKQSRVPMNMLKHLWEVEDEGVAAILAKEFEQVGLADMEIETRKDGMPVELLRLHDSVYDFAVHESRVCKEESVGHEAVIRGYGNELKRTGKGCREWWSRRMEVDGYIHRNVCGHLLGADCANELGELLITPEWTERQLEVSGVIFVEGDFGTGINAVREGYGDYVGEEREELEDALQLIKESLSLSSGYVGRNPRELWFQMHGRLHGFRRGNGVIEKYVEWIESNAPRPRVLSVNRFLVEPGGPNTRIVSPGAALGAMATLGDGDRVLCGCEDGRIAVVNVRHGEVERVWKSEVRGISSIACTRDGSRVVIGSYHGSAEVWEVQSGRCIAILTESEEITDTFERSVAITNDGKWAAYGGGDGTFQVWEADTGRSVIRPVESHDADLLFIELFGDGGNLVTGGKDGVLRVWNKATGVQVGEFEGHSDDIRCIAISRNEKRVVSGGGDGTVRVWDLESLEQIGQAREEARGAISSVAVSGDGNRVIHGTYDYKIRVWDVNSGKQVCAPLTGHSSDITGVVFLADDDSIVSCSLDGSVRVWDLTRTATENTIEGHTYGVTAVTFTQDGSFVVSGSWDKSIRIWDARTGTPVGDPLQGHTESVSGVAVTPDGRYVVSFSSDNTVRVWDFRRRSLLHTFVGHTRLITCVAISPDGDYALTASWDKTVRLWNLRSMDGSHVMLEGHSRGVERVFFSDDGLRIISVDCDGSIFVWDIETKKRIRSALLEGLLEEWPLSALRIRILELAGEPSPSSGPAESIRVIGRRQIVLSDEPDVPVSATFEEDIRALDLSSDGKTLCLGLARGKVAFLNVHIVVRSSKRLKTGAHLEPYPDTEFRRVAGRNLAAALSPYLEP